MYCLTRKVTVVYVEFWTSVCERDVDKLLVTSRSHCIWHLLTRLNALMCSRTHCGTTLAYSSLCKCTLKLALPAGDLTGPMPRFHRSDSEDNSRGNQNMRRFGAANCQPLAELGGIH